MNHMVALGPNLSVPLLDIIAFWWFIVGWLGYAYFSKHIGYSKHNLLYIINEYRLQWMRVMLRRENRLVDVSAIGNLLRSISFFASTCILLQIGLFTMFGYRDEGQALISALPFGAPENDFMWEFKIFLLSVIFIYGFFKFTWSLRQYNYACIFVCSCPPPHELKSDHVRQEMIAHQGARLVTNAAGHFNLGMRAYYYGLATCSWFLHGWCFILATTLVVLVLYRREYRSYTHEIMSKEDFLKKQPAW